MGKLRIGIDVGGTFTDLVALDEETGQTRLVKTSSTPRDPSEGAINAIEEFVLTAAGEPGLIVHASTVGTNLFLGQLGLDIPKGALVTTTGFGDILEIGRQKRPELYNPFFARPRPLIEREKRFTIEERTGFDGEILKPVKEDEVMRLAAKLKKMGIECIAVVFLHSYANPVNERRTAHILSNELPDKVIVTSQEIDPAYREYERTSTTIVNTLMIPVVSRYLRELNSKLKNIAIDAPLYVMQSNGGLATTEVASRFPASTVESGPATGVTAAAHWSRLVDRPNILSFDMGGTTAKAGLVTEHVPQMVSECEVGGLVHSGRIVKGSGYPVRYPFIDLAEVSGGGGTIARIDDAGALTVGPTSAGADPGPACYGTGGHDPTVTDANLVLGRLNPDSLSGGSLKIYPELAHKVITDKIAKPLGLSTIEAASGIIHIVNNQMMRALRLVSIERGHDPRDYTMLAFGGSGPMHAPFLAEGLGIEDIFVPPASGVFSALGLLLADFRHDFIRPVMRELSTIDLELLKKSFREMGGEATRILSREGFTKKTLILERNLALRYVGQSYEVLIPFDGMLKHAADLFHRCHEEIYGYAPQDEPVEAVSAHLIARGITRKPELETQPPGDENPTGEAFIDERMTFFSQTGWVSTPVVLRDHLRAGNRIESPAVIEQYDATTIIPPGWCATVDELGNIRLKTITK